MANEQIIDTYVSSVSGFQRFVPDTTNAPYTMLTTSGSLFIAGLKYSIPGFTHEYQNGYDTYDEIVANLGVIGVGDGSTFTFSGTLQSPVYPLLPGGIRITDGTQSATDRATNQLDETNSQYSSVFEGLGVFKGDITGNTFVVNSINYTTGEYIITFSSAPAANETIRVWSLAIAHTIATPGTIPARVSSTSTVLQKVVTNSSGIDLNSCKTIALSEWETPVFVAGRNLQSRELNEVVSSLKTKISEVGATVHSDGDIITGCQVVISPNVEISSTLGQVYEVTITAGSVYFDGGVHQVPESVVYITKQGTEFIGLKIIEDYLTDVDDAYLRDPATGFDGTGLPGAWRKEFKLSWVANEKDLQKVFEFQEGNLLNQNPPTIFSKINPTLARRTNDESGAYKVTGLTGRIEKVYETGVTSAGTTVTTLNDQVWRLIVDEGVAYVNGYEVRKNSSSAITYRRAVDIGSATFDFTYQPPQVTADTESGPATVVRYKRPNQTLYKATQQPLYSVNSVIGIARTPKMQFTLGGATTGSIDLVALSSTAFGSLGAKRYSGIPNNIDDARIMIYTSSAAKDGDEPDKVAGTDYTVDTSGDSITLLGTWAANTYYCFWNYTTANGQSPLIKGTRLLTQYKAGDLSYDTLSFTSGANDLLHGQLTHGSVTSRPLPKVNLAVENIVVKPTASDADKGISNYFVLSNDYDKGNENYQKFIENIDYKLDGGDYVDSTEAIDNVQYRKQDAAKFFVDILATGGSHGVVGPTINPGTLPAGAQNVNYTFNLARPPIKPKGSGQLHIYLAKPTISNTTDIITQDNSFSPLNAGGTGLPYMIIDKYGNGNLYAPDASETVVGTVDYTTGLVTITSWFYTEYGTAYDNTNSASQRHCLIAKYAHGAGVTKGSIHIIPGSSLSDLWEESIVNVPSGGVAGLNLRASYEYWDSSQKLWNADDGVGDFLGPDSYLEESDITGTITFPNIAAATGKKYRVPYERLLDWQKQAIDLRPNAEKTDGGRLSITKGWDNQFGSYVGSYPSNLIPNQGYQTTASIGFYQNRWDTVSLAPDGRIEINYGPAGSRSEPPSAPLNSLGIMNIYQTGNTEAPQIKDTAVVRSTMEDISNIEKRVSNLEEVVAINALESNALTASRGLQLRGIVTDNFTNFQNFELEFKGPWSNTDTPKWLDGTGDPTSKTKDYVVGDRVLPMKVNSNTLEHYYALVGWELVCVKSGISAVVYDANTFNAFLTNLNIGDIWQEGESTSNAQTGQTPSGVNCAWRVVKKRVPSRWLDSTVSKDGSGGGDYSEGSIVRDPRGIAPVYFKCILAGTPGTTRPAAYTRNLREGDRITDNNVTWAAIPKTDFDIDMVEHSCGIDNLARCLTLREHKTRNYTPLWEQLRNKITGNSFGLLLYDQTLLLGDQTNPVNWNIFIQPMASSDVPVNLYNEFEALRVLRLSPSSLIWSDTQNSGKMTGKLPGSNTNNLSVGFSGSHGGAGINDEDLWIDPDDPAAAFWAPDAGKDVEPLPNKHPLGSIKNSDTQFVVGQPISISQIDVSGPGATARYNEDGNVVATVGNKGNEEFPDANTGIAFVPQEITTTSTTNTVNLGNVVVSTSMATQIRGQYVRVIGESWPLNQEITCTINGTLTSFDQVYDNTTFGPSINGGFRTVLPSTKEDETWGTFNALIYIPTGTPTGNIEIKCTSAGISKTTNFLAVGSVAQTKNLELTQTNTHTEVVGSLCPIAQTFMIDGGKGEIWATGCAIAFSVPSEAGLPPGELVNIQLRNVINGYPGDTILAKGKLRYNMAISLNFPHQSNLRQSNIKEQANSQIPPSHIANDSLTQYPIYFENPVLIYPDVEYALVVLNKVDNFYVWTGKIGEKNLASPSSSLITAQPSLGSFFNSQNNTTWTPDQYRDLSFKILGTRPSANQNKVSITFDNDKGIRGARYKFNSTQYEPNYISDDSNAGIKWEVSWNNGTNWVEILPKAAPINMTKVMRQARLRLTMEAGRVVSGYRYHSPSINPERFGLYAFSDTGSTLSLDSYKTLWPNSPLPTDATTPSEGGVFGTYVSKNTTFFNGRFSTLRIITEEYRPENSKLEYWYSVDNGKNWLDLPSSTKDRITNYTDYEQLNFGNYIYEATRTVQFNRVATPSAISFGTFGNVHTGSGWDTSRYYWIRYTFVTPYGESLPSALGNGISPTHAADTSDITLPSGSSWPENNGYNSSRPVKLFGPKVKFYIASTSASTIYPEDEDFQLLEEAVAWKGDATEGSQITFYEPKIANTTNPMPKVNGTLPKQFRILAKLNAQAEARLIDNPSKLLTLNKLNSGGSLAMSKTYQVAYTWVYADDIEPDDPDLYERNASNKDKIDLVIENDPVVSGDPKTYYETAPYRYLDDTIEAVTTTSNNSRISINNFETADWPENAICALFYIRDVTSTTETDAITVDTPQWRRATINSGNTDYSSLKRNYSDSVFYINAYPTTSPILTPPIQNETPGLTANGPQIRALRMIASAE